MMLRTLASLGLWLAAVPAAFAADLITMSPQQQQNLGVAAAPLQPTRAAFGRALPAQVVIPPGEQQLISAPQAGMVTQLRRSIGDEVKQGEALLTLQSPEIVGLQRAFLQALSQEHLAKTALERDNTLFREGIIAQRRYLETQSRYQEQKAAFDERRQALRLAGMATQDIRRLERTRSLSSALVLRAPMDGVVLERQAQTGQRVDVNAPLYRIGRLDTLWLEIRAPIETLSGLRVGAPVQVADAPVTAKLILIGREVDPASQTALLRAEVTGNGEHLRPGQYVQATLTTHTAEHSFTVPAAAVVRRDQKTYVFVKSVAGFTATPVRVWLSEGGTSVISGSFSGGEQIAVSGVAAIKGAWMGLGGGE